MYTTVSNTVSTSNTTVSNTVLKQLKNTSNNINNINMDDIYTPRAGVIPYTVVGGQVYFLLGIDNPSLDITDFGGGRHNGYNGNVENSMECAIREFKEETNSIFPKIYYRKDFFNDSIVIKNQNMMIFFIYINNKWFETAKPRFCKKKKYVCYKKEEISNILWIHSNRFRQMCIYNNDKHKLWDYIRPFIKEHIDNIINNILIKIK